MANKIRVGSLDFDTVKQSLVDYLNTQGVLTDHNFEGSGLSTIVNLLAYNSHYNALAANFLANEMFLDTAQKRQSVVSHAKSLGYNARSRRSAQAELQLTFYSVANAATVESIVVPKGAKFSCNINDTYYTFTTRTATSFTRSVENSEYIYRGTITVYEGALTQQTLTYSSTEGIINIPNVDMDTSTLKVEVRANSNYAWEEFMTPASFLTLTSTDNAYFINEGFNGYDIRFGDGVFGQAVANGSDVRLTYMVTSGSGANEGAVFNSISTIAGTEGSILKISALVNSNGGAEKEDIETIRNNATLQYGTQNRAVVARDYASLTLQNFSFAKDCLAWDGAENVPPKFGRVMLCVQPQTGDSLTTANKAAITSFMSGKSVANVKVEFVDPDYVDLIVDTKVKYNANTISLSTYDLEYAVKMAIYNYAANNIFMFGSKFRYSNLVRAIDGADYSIVSNLTTVKLIKSVTPTLYAQNSFRISYANALKRNTFQSSTFYDASSVVVLYLKDDGNGVINTVYDSNGLTKIYASGVGAIDYNTGAITIDGVSISSLGGTALKVKFTAEPAEQDVVSVKNVILNLTTDNINISLVADQ